jgi:hypothetical protein|tara:strand:- start:1156 stop:1380 length:225 start_codon:yes stop_codon:yes gene_type:complete
MIIRKISVGPDYKSGAMHYIVGQSILGDNYIIDTIRKNKETDSFEVWIKKGDEIVLWKEFSSTVPVSIENNINF